MPKTSLKTGSLSKKKDTVNAVKSGDKNVEPGISAFSELFEETLSIAEDDGATKELSQFVSFITDYLPPEVLDQLISLAGFTDTGDEGSPGSSGQSSTCIELFLEDVWRERYEMTIPSAATDDMDSSTAQNPYECELCERVIQTTRHHVYPRETHEWLQKRDPDRYTDRELGTTINLCRMCHSAIHRFYTNRQLAEEYYSLELLLESEQVCKFAKWASTLQGRGNLSIK
jgi:hypothetical protein